MSHPATALDVPVPEAIALAWSFEPMVVVPLVAAAALYLRGWAALRPRMPERFGPGRAAAFAAGLGVVLLALCSPIDALGHRWLQAHLVPRKPLGCQLFARRRSHLVEKPVGRVGIEFGQR